MELKDYLHIINRNWLSIVGITIITFTLIIAWSKLTPAKYESSNTIVVNKPNPVSEQTANYFQYDKYYSIQASALEADTLTAWLSSPDIAKQIYEKADLIVPDVTLKKLSKIFKPRRQPPVTLSIMVADRDRNKAERLVNAAVAVIEGKVQAQRQNDDTTNYFTLLTGTTVTAINKPDLAVNGLLSLIAGLILGFVFVFLKHYLRQ